MKRMRVKARRAGRRVKRVAKPVIKLVKPSSQEVVETSDFVPLPIVDPKPIVCEKPIVPPIDIIDIRTKNENYALRDTFQ
jgi:hypothetical protein